MNGHVDTGGSRQFDGEDRPMAVIAVTLTVVMHDGEGLDVSSASAEEQRTVTADADEWYLDSVASDLADRLKPMVGPVVRSILDNR